MEYLFLSLRDCKRELFLVLFMTVTHFSLQYIVEKQSQAAVTSSCKIFSKILRNLKEWFTKKKKKKFLLYLNSPYFK